MRKNEREKRKRGNGEELCGIRDMGSLGARNNEVWRKLRWVRIGGKRRRDERRGKGKEKGVEKGNIDGKGKEAEKGNVNRKGRTRR